MAFLLILGAVRSPSAEANRLNETRETLAKWVETRQLVSRTRIDWQADKEMMQASVKLFERELLTVQEQMAKLSTNTTQVESERVQAEVVKKSSHESIEASKKFAVEFERELVRMAPKLPAPLQDNLKPLLNRIPADTAATRLSAAERIQVIVGILSELDKFNNAVSVFSEKRKTGKGEEVATETVYVGLGAAYFVNDANDFAGTGAPGANGWEWTVKSELAAAVREVVRIYRNERPARFVALPATIK